MGNYLYPVPDVSVRLVSVNGSECTFSFDLDGMRTFIVSTPRNVVVPGSSARLWVKGVRPQPIVVDLTVEGCVIREDGSEAVYVNKSSTPWVITFYNERRKMKLINNSSQEVSRVWSDISTVVPPGNYKEVQCYDHIVTKEGSVVDIMGCYTEGRHGINTKTYYEQDGLTFDCVDEGEMVVVTVEDKQF